MEPHDEVRLTLPLDRRFLPLARRAAADLAAVAGAGPEALAEAERAVEAVWTGGGGAIVTVTYRVGPGGLVVDSEVSP